MATVPTTVRGVVAKLRADLTRATQMAVADVAGAHGLLTAAVNDALIALDLLLAGEPANATSVAAFGAVRRWRLQHGEHPNPFEPEDARVLFGTKPPHVSDNNWSTAILEATSTPLDAEEVRSFVLRDGPDARWCVFESRLGGPVSLYTAPAHVPGQTDPGLRFRGHVKEAVGARRAHSLFCGPESRKGGAA